MNRKHLVCQYCLYRDKGCIDNSFSFEGCDTWVLDVNTLSDEQKKYIKNYLEDEVIARWDTL